MDTHSADAEIRPFRIEVPQADLDVRRVARAWATLMERLGYQRYGAQGGDWGSSISRELGVADPEHVAGVHLNMLIPFARDEPDDLTSVERARPLR